MIRDHSLNQTMTRRGLLVVLIHTIFRETIKDPFMLLFVWVENRRFMVTASVWIPLYTKGLGDFNLLVFLELLITRLG